MKLDSRKRIAAQLMKVGETRVWFDPERLEEIKEAITKEDIRSLIKDKAIQKKPQIGNSSYRDRKRKSQLKKGRRQGRGSQKGTHTARLPRKRTWINKIRAQRKLLRELFDKKVISRATYSLIYRKSKSGFFRSARHIKLYLTEQNLFEKVKK